MTNKCRILISLILMALSANFASGQDTIFARNINKYLSLDGKQLVIKYDLPYTDTTQLFDIVLRIYYNDKVIEPTTNSLTGSWGEKVKPGVEKVILWDFPNEFTGAINKVTIGVVARKMSTPKANFDYKVLSDKPSFQVRFENKSMNSDFYSWNFGDLKSRNTNTSFMPSPVHRYKSPGKYKVELIAGSNKTSTSDSIVKIVSVGKVNAQDIQKLKTLRTIFLGAAVATAGAGAFSLIKSNSLFNEWKKEGTDDLKKKYKTYEVIGPAAFVVSGACALEVFLKTKKIRNAEKATSMNFIPLGNGAGMELVLNF